MWAIVGLGNPGIRYKWNRHNIGFHVIDLLAKVNKIKLKKDKYTPAYTCKGNLGSCDVLLVKPAAYMNHSGTVVKAVKEVYNVPKEKILVIADDIDLPWGKIRIRRQGGSAGHKGMGSIIKELESENFPRIRMGIGRSGGKDVIQHVLGNFNKEERKELVSYCERAGRAVLEIINNNIDIAMNRFN